MRCHIVYESRDGKVAGSWIAENDDVETVEALLLDHVEFLDDHAPVDLKLIRCQERFCQDYKRHFN